VKFGHLAGPFPLRLGDLEFERSGDRAPFQTYDQIARTLARGDVTPEEEAALWECLYLTLEEVHQVLDHVREKAAHPFIHPMFAFAAMTGARRSEICRSRIEDFDFENRAVTIREKKRKRGRDSFRKVDMNGRLHDVMRAWLEIHPGGQFMIAKDGRPLTVKMATDHFKRVLSRTKWRVVPGFHTLRHSFASILASKGVDEATIDRFLGHQTEEQRERYRHLFPAGLKRSIALLD
jgi:integrase